MPAGRIMEGSHAVAQAVGLCRPNVIVAYPITPQTHIVEALAQMVADGEINAQFVNVESEFAAASMVLGASTVGARVYTASSSQGILLMTEVLYNISGLRLPVILTCVNRSVSAPLNIWNDQQDSMSVRDSGWLQFYAEDPQEAADLHICAYKVAEDNRVLLPAMVCMDGFLLSHVFEPVELPEQEKVDSFLPPYKPVHTLDPDNPITMGTYADPQTYLEIRYMLNQAVLRSRDIIAETAQQFTETFGRKIYPFVEPYRMDDAETALVAMGSIAAVAKDAVDERRAQGERVGVLRVVTFRPFPAAEILDALQGVERVGVLDKAISLGAGGPLALEVRNALYGHDGPAVTGFILGLGGRDVSTKSIHRALDRLRGPAADMLFVDLDTELVGDLAQTWQREWQPA